MRSTSRSRGVSARQQARERRALLGEVEAVLVDADRVGERRRRRRRRCCPRGVSKEIARYAPPACSASSTSSSSAPTASAISATDGWRRRSSDSSPTARSTLQRELLQVARHADRPGAVAEVALDLAEDRRDRVGGERDLALGVEAVDRLDQADRRDLEEVVERLARALVAAGELARQRQEALDELLARPGVAGAVAQEQLAVLAGALGAAPGGSAVMTTGLGCDGAGRRTGTRTSGRNDAPEVWGASCSGGGPGRDVGHDTRVAASNSDLRGSTAMAYRDDAHGPADPRRRRGRGDAARDRRAARGARPQGHRPRRPVAAGRRRSSPARTPISRSSSSHDDDEHALDLIEEIGEYARGPDHRAARRARADVRQPRRRARDLRLRAPALRDEVQGAIELALRRHAERARLTEQVEQLESALERRGTIERAKGILMERHGVDDRQAFELLRQHARRTNRRVVDLARAVADGHALLPEARLARPARRDSAPAGTPAPHVRPRQARVQEVPGRQHDRSRGGADVLRDDVAVPRAARRASRCSACSATSRSSTKAVDYASDNGAPPEVTDALAPRCSGVVNGAGGAVSVTLVIGIALALYGASGAFGGAGPGAERRVHGVEEDAQLRPAQAQRPRLDDRRHRARARRDGLGLPRRRDRRRPVRDDRPRRHRGGRSGASRAGSSRSGPCWRIYALIYAFAPASTRGRGADLHARARSPAWSSGSSRRSASSSTSRTSAGTARPTARSPAP